MKATVKIGVISDTHGLLRPEAESYLSDVDLILHAGDIGKQEVLTKLETMAPVVAVRGNVDKGDWADDLPERATPEINGKRLLLIHNIGEFDVDSANNFDAVIFGHSHMPRNETLDGLLYFNPGSAGPRRFRLPVSIGLLKIGRQGIMTTIDTLID